MPICQKCGDSFPSSIRVGEKRLILNSRKYCLNCSPYKEHNTRKLNGELRKDGRGGAPLSPLAPSQDLSYLIGVIAGDGCLYRYPRTVELIIACDNYYPALIATYSELVARLIPGRVRVVSHKYQNYTMIRISNANLPVLLGLPCGAKATNNFTVPDWIFASTDFTKWFIKGLLETDGGIYIINRGKAQGWHCHFTAKYDNIMNAFLKGTQLLGFIFRRSKDKAILAVTQEVKLLIHTLEITKFREYTY